MSNNKKNNNPNFRVTLPKILVHDTIQWLLYGFIIASLRNDRTINDAVRAFQNEYGFDEDSYALETMKQNYHRINATMRSYQKECKQKGVNLLLE